MRPQMEEFEISTRRPGHAVLAGVLRLPSPAAYDEHLAPVREALCAAGPTFTVDLSGLKFLNSSGITGLSRMVLLARSLGTSLVLIGSKSVPWHAKTLGLLERLYDQLEVRLV